jgi:cell surface protein SprA
MIFDPLTNKFDFNVSRNETGNYNISTFTFFKSLSDKGKGINSSLFDEFLTERRNVANELGAANANSNGEIQYVDIKGTKQSYIDGYDNNQQDVLVGAFYKTYTGRSISITTPKIYSLKYHYQILR